jgi:3-hydroxyacyl-CoA dehydrogenase/enoyl-CoA hydratase/3-hydroxybutyryl-CoA epimerase
MENAARMLVLSGTPPRQLPLHAEADERPAEGRGRQWREESRWRSARARNTTRRPTPSSTSGRTTAATALAVPGDKPTSLDALVKHPTTRNLIRVFFLQDRLKGFGKDASKALRAAALCTWSAPASWAATSRLGACCVA